MGGSIGTSWSSGLSGQDHYNDQLSWRQTSNADGTASFTQTALNQVWGSATTTWASQGWGSLSGAGSGNVWNLGGSSSSVYGLAVSWVGFSGSAAFLLGPGGSGPSAFGIKIGLPTGGGGPLQYLQYLQYMGMGWWEANSFGTFSAGTPPSQWARGGLIAGHELALGQGVVEVLFGAGAIGGGGLISLTGIGAFIGVPAGVVGAVVVLHGGAVTVSAAGLLGRDFSLAMSSNIPAPGNPAPENRVPASEKTARDIAKQIERDLGPDARREFHDAKEGGAGDRTLEELKADARAIYEEHGMIPPKWLQ